MPICLNQNSQKILAGIRNVILPVFHSKGTFEARQAQILHMFKSGDEFDPDAFLKEENYILRLLADNDPLDFSIEKRHRRRCIRAILQEAKKVNPEIGNPSPGDDGEIHGNLLAYCHLTRMELSRYEREDDVLAAVAFEIEFLKNLSETVTPFVTASGDYIDRLDKLELNSAYLSALDLDWLSTRIPNIKQLIDQEIVIWDSIHDIYLENLIDTNDSIHVFENEKFASRYNVSVTPKRLRHLENLTKIWIKYIDPNLGLPARDGEPNNPYVRAMLAALAFSDITDFTAGQIVDRANRLFRRRFASRRRP